MEVLMEAEGLQSSITEFNNSLHDALDPIPNTHIFLKKSNQAEITKSSLHYKAAFSNAGLPLWG